MREIILGLIECVIILAFLTIGFYISIIDTLVMLIIYVVLREIKEFDNRIKRLEEESKK